MDLANLVAAAISTVGTLGGVALGAWLTNRAQRTMLLEERTNRSVAERRRVYAEFLSTTRAWRSISQGPEVHLVEGSAVSRQAHADAGDFGARALALRSEIALIAH